MRKSGERKKTSSVFGENRGPVKFGRPLKNFSARKSGQNNCQWIHLEFPQVGEKSSEILKGMNNESKGIEEKMLSNAEKTLLDEQSS